ncbi:carboxylesterase/lipase family protein [Actinomadura craniellae]|nr:carboxylesterase family protein [Actinomadura craniellae]
MRPVRIALLTSVLSVLSMAAAVPAVAHTKPPESGSSAVVRTDKGTVRGLVREDHRLFQGIPYAKPPVGKLRWTEPRPADPWRGVLDGTAPRSQCAQPAPAYGGTATYEEDCLYLNVTTPDRRDRHGKGHARLPVMVWLHGGGNTTGNGSSYNGAKLAVDGNVVVVTIHYRLGALGWLAHPAFEAGDQRRYQAGNYGLLDQQAALRWVQRNITAFGGDPRNVTLFGESAGSADTCANLASPPARGLFHKAIPQSGTCASPSHTAPTAEANAQNFAGAVGCGEETTPAGTAACLRALPAKTLVDTFLSTGMGAGPVTGGDHVLPLRPRDALEQGKLHRVPIMHGNTLDEMRVYVAGTYPRPITVAQYEQIVRTTYGANADKVLARYPAADYPDLRIGLATMQTHFGGGLSSCLTQTGFKLFEKTGVPVYAYQFADRNAPPLIEVPDYEEGAQHATELTYLFPGLLGELDAKQQRLSDAMVGYWTSFAHTGRPKAHGAPRWPAYRSTGDVLSLAPGERGTDGIRLVDTYEQSNCAFWESLTT